MQLNDVLKMAEKQWTQKGNGVQATINVVHKASQGQYGWKQPVNITDLTGNTMDITLQTEYPDSLLTQDHVGKNALWRLKWWKSRGGQSISGYVETQLDSSGNSVSWQLPQGDATPQAPQNQPFHGSIPQQGTQQAAQPTNAPQNVQMRMPDTYAYPVTPETANRMARAVVIVAMLRNGDKPLLSYVTELVDYIRTGIEVSNAPDMDAEITECSHCKKPHKDCICTVPF